MTEAELEGLALALRATASLAHRTRITPGAPIANPPPIPFSLSQMSSILYLTSHGLTDPPTSGERAPNERSTFATSHCPHGIVVGRQAPTDHR